MEVTGTRQALSAAEARTPMDAWPSSVWERMSHMPSTTPRMAVSAAMMNVTGMLACTAV